MKTDDERAEWWDEHIDDPSLMADPVPPPVNLQQPKRLRMSLTVRLTEDETEWIRAEAQRSRRSYSEVVREIIRQQLGPAHVARPVVVSYAASKRVRMAGRGTGQYQSSNRSRALTLSYVQSH